MCVANWQIVCVCVCLRFDCLRIHSRPFFPHTHTHTPDLTWSRLLLSLAWRRRDDGQLFSSTSWFVKRPFFTVSTTSVLSFSFSLSLSLSLFLFIIFCTVFLSTSYHVHAYLHHHHLYHYPLTLSSLATPPPLATASTCLLILSLPFLPHFFCLFAIFACEHHRHHSYGHFLRFIRFYFLFASFSRKICLSHLFGLFLFFSLFCVDFFSPPLIFWPLYAFSTSWPVSWMESTLIDWDCLRIVIVCLRLNCSFLNDVILLRVGGSSVILFLVILNLF